MRPNRWKTPNPPRTSVRDTATTAVVISRGGAPIDVIAKKISCWTTATMADQTNESNRIHHRRWRRGQQREFFETTRC